MSAPDWRREDATPQKGAEHERVSEGEWESDGRGKKQEKEKEIDVCVCVLVFWENTCGRRTRADGEHGRRQRPAVGQREKGSHDSLLFFFINLGIVCVSVVGGLVR